MYLNSFGHWTDISTSICTMLSRSFMKTIFFLGLILVINHLWSNNYMYVINLKYTCLVLLLLLFTYYLFSMTMLFIQLFTNWPGGGNAFLMMRCLISSSSIRMSKILVYFTIYTYVKYMLHVTHYKTRTAWSSF